jgi:hypothetical protein
VKRGKEEREEGQKREWVVGKEGSGWWKGRKGGRACGWEEADMFGFSLKEGGREGKAGEGVDGR